MIRFLGAGAVALLIGLVVWIGCDLTVRGAAGFHPGYLFEPPVDLGRSGGIGPVLISTAIVVGSAVILATLVSLPAAILYTELPGPSIRQRILQAVFDVGVGTPRIVWGLCGGVLVGGVLGFGFSIVTGVVTLACLLAPILTTGFIAGLQAVGGRLRMECAALGLTRWSMLWTQLIPAARPALAATVALAVGRGLGDAAALLFTAGVSAELPRSLLDPATTLAVFVFHLLSSVPGGQHAAYSAAAVLFLITLLIQAVIARLDRQERFAR